MSHYCFSGWIHDGAPCDCECPACTRHAQWLRSEEHRKKIETARLKFDAEFQVRLQLAKEQLQATLKQKKRKR